jgi:hypothetical protein
VRIDRPDEDDAPTVDRDSPVAEPDTASTERDAVRDLPGADFSASPADRMAEHIRYRAVVECETARQVWAEALPEFRATWEEHLKRYPHPERPETTVRADASWHGDGTLELNHKQNLQVDSRYEQICETGKEVILPALRRLEAEDPERHLAGLENFLKKPDRLKEKVAGDIEYKACNAEQSLDNIKDAVRFTLVYAEERYSEGVQADCARLEAIGFERYDRQNSWQQDQYKGINSRWRDPESGLLFEVQFHTQASFDAKELTHKAYERLRGSVALDAERTELEAFQSAVSAKIPTPPGATEIEDYSLRKRDG